MLSFFSRFRAAGQKLRPAALFVVGFAGFWTNCALANPAVGPTPHSAISPQASPWKIMTLSDLAAAKGLVESQDINFVYPNPRPFMLKLNSAKTIADQEASAVDSFGGYRAVLKRFINALDDEHVFLRLSISQTRLSWPGFVIRRLGGRYVTAASTLSKIKDGQEVSACDGISLDRLVAQIATFEGGHPGLESTKASAALALLIDRSNPFLERPTDCEISGRNVHLEWKPIYYPDYVRSVKSLAGAYDRTVAINDIRGDIAWVKIGNFDPRTPNEVSDFRHLIAETPSLRNKRAIILDVRQNRGGPYDWMVAFLQSLYGRSYAAYYARARLSIQPVTRATPQILRAYTETDASDSALGTPKDAQTEDASSQGLARAVAAGELYYRSKLKITAAPPEPPPSPVKSRVFVLTDYGCMSVCIGFVDEMKRFPGVRQIGTETFVDSRSGTPLSRPLPSGNGTVSVPTMTRDGRARGDNVPQRPESYFSGDINDTAAVRHWIVQDLLPRRAK